MIDRLEDEIQNDYYKINRLINQNFEKAVYLGKSSVVGAILVLIEQNRDINFIKSWIIDNLEEDSMLREYTYRYIDELRINNKEGI